MLYADVYRKEKGSRPGFDLIKSSLKIDAGGFNIVLEINEYFKIRVIDLGINQMTVDGPNNLVILTTMNGSTYEVSIEKVSIEYDYGRTKMSFSDVLEKISEESGITFIV